MSVESQNSKLEIQIGLCIFFVTVTVWTSGLSEPVALPKLAILAPCALAIFGSIVPNLRNVFSSKKFFLMGTSFFILWLTVASVASPNPISRSFYGVEARNTGWLTYFSLALLSISASCLSNRNSYKYLYMAFLGASVVNIFYGIYVLAIGKDPIPWNNVYGSFLGTLGNPNFISSFLGFATPVFLALALSSDIKVWQRATATVLLPVILFEIIQTNSIQGIVVAALGSSLFIGLKIKFSVRNPVLTKLYFGTLLASAVLAVLGTLQKGPLASILYKDSVSYRGEYWAAGIKMIKSNPVFGLGPDSYGNWYRLYRDSSAVIRPGAETTTNAAHNVFIDIGVNGGIPLLLAYALIAILVVLKIVRVLKASKNLDRVFWSFSIIWICYQVQSIISINQIGLAIWGWVLTGVILSYPIPSEINEIPKRDSKVEKGRNAKVQLDSGAGVVFGTLGFIFGLVAVVPPVAADHAWRQGLEVSDANVLDKALQKWPQESNRLVIGSSIFGRNKLNDFAIKFARASVKHDPNHFDSWRNLSRIPGATVAEITKAKQEMKRLDPLNPDHNKN